MDPKIEHEATVYQSARCRVAEMRYRMPNGAVAERPIVYSPGAVTVVARPEPDRVVLVRQYRYALADWTWELPAGTRGADEDPLVCAKRELIEEAGFEADHWQELYTWHPAPGLTDEIMTLFAASSLHNVGHQPEDDELIEVHVQSDDWVRAQLADGTITDAKTIIGLSFIGLTQHRPGVADGGDAKSAKGGAC